MPPPLFSGEWQKMCQSVPPTLHWVMWHTLTHFMPPPLFSGVRQKMCQSVPPTLHWVMWHTLTHFMSPPLFSGVLQKMCQSVPPSLDRAMWCSLTQFLRPPCFRVSPCNRAVLVAYRTGCAYIGVDRDRDASVLTRLRLSDVCTCSFIVVWVCAPPAILLALRL
jgi:hypothetical protein